MKYKLPAIVGMMLLVGLWASPAWARKWQSKEGGFAVEAELVEATATDVRLRKDNGKEITVAIDKLSAADVAYLKSLEKPQKPGGEAKLTPIQFKIFDQELTIDAPAGAKVEIQGEFPVIRQGKTFIMSIQPTVDSDLSDFKEQFTKPSEFVTLKKTFLDEENAQAHKVLMKAFKQEATVYMVVVTVGDKKFTCADVSLEEMNSKDKRSPQDVEVLIQSAKSLKAAE